MPAPAKKPPAARSAAPPSAMQQGALLAAARRGPRHKKAQKQQINQIMKLGMGLILGVMLVLGIVFGIKAMQGPPAPVVGKDAEVLKEMKRVTYEEANSWFSQGHDRVFVGHTKGQTRTLIDELYGLKPKQVLAGGGRMSMHVIIELPGDVEARTMIFAWHNGWLDRFEPGTPHERDVGQRYLMLHMPLNR